MISQLRRRAALGCVALAIGLFLSAAAASAEAAAPAWGLQISHSPATLHREEAQSTYTLTLTNTGDAPTSDPIVLTNDLPPDVSLLGVSPGAFFSCEGDGGAATPLVCTRSESLAAGESDSVTVGVLVGPGAADTVTNFTTVSGGGAISGASASDPTPVADLLPFGIKSFAAATTTDTEATFTVAGGHPFANSTRFELPTRLRSGPPGLETVSVEVLKDAGVDVPTGFIGNPAAAPRCPISGIAEIDFASHCPAGSKVGFAIVGEAGETFKKPIYNVKPDRGYPAQFIFKKSTYVSLYATSRPRTESYGLTVGATDANRLEGVSLVAITFYGVPSENGSGNTNAPFLSNPVDCSDVAPTWKLALDSWEKTGLRLPTGVPDLSDPNWKTAISPASSVTGCNDPKLTSQFHPTIEAKPLQGGGPVQADAPTGLAVDLDFPQSNDPTDPDTTYDPKVPQAPEPKDITVKLPVGLSINPSSADGLGACSDLASDSAGDQVHYDNVKPVTCPDSSKIGTVTATTPLLASHDPVTDAVNGAEPIPGDVYLLKPHPGDLVNGQDGKFRLLIQLENPRYGINFKLPGIAVANKQTGQLTTVFTDNPQLPASHLQVSLLSGPRAPLATPVTCGNFDTTTDLVPWSTPGTSDANPTASFNVSSGPGGTPCAATPAQRPFATTMSAGTESNAAGKPSPFVLRLSRNDGEGELSSLEATLPKGLAAKFVGVPYCSDAALAAAATRIGKAEQSNPSCPASRIGAVTVAAGPGPNPFYAKGNAYLAGPYKGAPLSVAVITPAVAGPFDLGTVVVRNALYVDPETAQGRVVSDPFPKIIDGVPLKLRSIDVKLDRPSFTLNPTNCSPMSVNAVVKSSDGATANPSSFFQAAGCKALGFKPDLKLSLKGDTKRSGHPALKAVLNYPKGNYANIAKAIVSLPHSEFLAQNHIKTICTRVQFAADACPPGSIYGYATATTPLLDKPLEGPLYLRSSSHPLPDLVAALHGQIDVDLVGRIDSKNGGIRTTFDSVPDAPVSRFVLTMQGGKKGLLENSRNLCASVNKADVRFTAQNGKVANSTPVLTNSCPKRKHGKGKAHKSASRLLSSLGF